MADKSYIAVRLREREDYGNTARQPTPRIEQSDPLAAQGRKADTLARIAALGWTEPDYE